jgi:hypothetical protein
MGFTIVGLSGLIISVEVGGGLNGYKDEKYPSWTYVYGGILFMLVRE